jgi:hypothetical protein
MKIKQSELAKIIGISRQAISKAKMKEWIEFDKNGFFNTLNKKNKSYLAGKGIDPKTGKKIDVKTEVRELKQRTKKAKTAPKKKKVYKAQNKKTGMISNNRPVGSDFSVMTRLPEAMLSMTLRELAIRHGTQQQLKEYVTILDKLMSAAQKDVKIQESRKNLLPRTLLDYMFQYLEVLNNQIFNYAQSARDEIISVVQADIKKARVKIPEMILKDLSKLIKESKKNIQRELKKYENSLDSVEVE